MSEQTISRMTDTELAQAHQSLQDALRSGLLTGEAARVASLTFCAIVGEQVARDIELRQMLGE